MEPFYKISTVNSQLSIVQVTVTVNPEHPIYKAHFPGHPITPGAMLVRMAIEVVADQCGLERDATELKNVKFLAPHHPDEQTLLTFSFDKDKRPVDVVIAQDGVTYAKMTLIF